MLYTALMKYQFLKQLNIILQVLKDYEKIGLNFSHLKQFLTNLPEQFKTDLFQKNLQTGVQNGFKIDDEEYLSFLFDDRPLETTGFCIVHKTKTYFERYEFLPLRIYSLYNFHYPFVKYYKKTKNIETNENYFFEKTEKHSRVNFKKTVQKNKDEKKVEYSCSSLINSLYFVIEKNPKDIFSIT
jgi:hypothetical protein